MVKLGLDISTVATGVVLQTNNDRPTKLATLFATDKNTTARIRSMVLKIFNYMERCEFDIAVITKAKTRFVEPNVALIEGAVLGKCIMMNKKIDYYPDSAWYSKFGSMKDKRPTKKMNSVLRFIKRTHIRPDVMELQKIKKGRRISKINIILRNGNIITDDVADAYNAVDLYEKRMVDYQIKSDAETLKHDLKKLKNKLLNSKKRLENNKKQMAEIEHFNTDDMKVERQKIRRKINRTHDNIKKYSRAIYDLEREYKKHVRKEKL